VVYTLVSGFQNPRGEMPKRLALLGLSFTAQLPMRSWHDYERVSRRPAIRAELHLKHATKLRPRDSHRYPGAGQPFSGSETSTVVGGRRRPGHLAPSPNRAHLDALDFQSTART
jgi:hypothetical protein